MCEIKIDGDVDIPEESLGLQKDVNVLVKWPEND